MLPGQLAVVAVPCPPSLTLLLSLPILVLETCCCLAVAAVGPALLSAGQTPLPGPHASFPLCLSLMVAASQDRLHSNFLWSVR